MRIANDKLDTLVDRLLGVLDEDMKHIKVTLERLNKLRAAVIKRDEKGLKLLLDEVKADQEDYDKLESMRNKIRKELADILGCGVGEMNLSRLCNALAGERGDSVAQVQKDLKELAGNLQREHLATSMLLRECGRFNSMLLRQILGKGVETVTYNDRGSASWEVQQGMVSLRF